MPNTDGRTAHKLAQPELKIERQRKLVASIDKLIS
jgi:hypothetical protein